MSVKEVNRMLSYEEQKDIAYTLNTNSAAISNEAVVNLYRKLTYSDLLLKVKKALYNRGFQHLNQIEEHYHSIIK